jgi:hypothetical protein
MKHNLMKTMGLEAASRLAVLVALTFLGFAGCGRQPKPEEVHIQVTACRYALEPAVIRVMSPWRSTTDVQHGFSIKELGIDESVQKGRPAVVSLRPRQTGEYKVKCSILCGPRHDQMQGTLVVE